MLCDNINEIVNSFKNTSIKMLGSHLNRYSQDIWLHKFLGGNQTEIQIVMKFKELCKLLN